METRLTTRVLMIGLRRLFGGSHSRFQIPSAFCILAITASAPCMVFSECSLEVFGQGTPEHPPAIERGCFGSLRAEWKVPLGERDYFVGFRDIAVAPGGSIVFAVPSWVKGCDSLDDKCYVFENRKDSSRQLSAKEGYNFRQLAVSPDGEKLAALMVVKTSNPHRDHEFIVGYVSVEDGRLLGTTTILSSSGGGNSLTFSPSGRFIECGYSGGIAIFKTTETGAFPTIGADANGVAISADGRYAALSGGSTLAELRSAQLFLRIPPRENQIGHVDFSSDGRLFALEYIRDRGTHVIEVWGTSRNERIASIDSITDPTVWRFVPNSNILAVGESHSRVVFFSIPSCRRVGVIEHPKSIGTLSLSSEGRCMVIGDDEAGKISLWDLNRAGIGRNRSPRYGGWIGGPMPSKAVLARWYEELGNPDVRVARKAMRNLEESGDDAVALLEKRLVPTNLDPKIVGECVERLGSDDFASRERAFATLERFARTATEQLEGALAVSDSLEVRIRLSKLLAHAREYVVSDQDCLRQIRAIECLGMINTDRAKRLLNRFVNGAPWDPVAQEAKAALVRATEWVSAD